MERKNTRFGSATTAINPGVSAAHVPTAGLTRMWSELNHPMRSARAAAGVASFSIEDLDFINERIRMSAQVERMQLRLDAQGQNMQFGGNGP